MKSILTPSIMILSIICLLPTLPPPVFFLLLVTCLLVLLAFCKRTIRPLLGLAVVSLSIGYLHLLHDVEGVRWSRHDAGFVEVSGQVVSVVKQGWRYSKPYHRFEFRVDSLAHQDADYRRAITGRRLMMSVYGDDQVVSLGQRYRMQVKIKPLVALNNRHGFDYVRHMLAQGVVARAVLDRHRPMLRLDDTMDRYRLRAIVRSRIYELTEGMAMRPIILALAVGDRTLLSDEDRERLIDLGIAHLLAVSGLHIGLAAMLGYWSVFVLARLFYRPLKWLRLDVLMLCSSALAAFYYALLAGFSVSAVRALIMVTVVLLCRLSWRRLQPLDAWVLALWLTLLYEPLQIYSAGLWLSFIAVFGLIYLGLGRRRGWWWPQLGLFFVMLVPSSIFFSKVSVVSPLLNLLAIPLVSLLVVPAVLLATLLAFVLPTQAGWLLSLIDQCLTIGWRGLVWFDEHSFTALTLAEIPALAYLAVGFAVLLLLMPRGLPGRWLAIVMTLPLWGLLVIAPTSPAGEVTILDVGQGLAVVVMSRHHVVVYDTGFGDGKPYAIGGRVVADFLQARGVKRIDRLVVSHEDSDHAGGVGELLRRFEVGTIVASRGNTFRYRRGVDVVACQKGMRWSYDEVSFIVLSPEAGVSTLSDNDRSCVLKVTLGGRSILLAGDIERQSELHLMVTDRASLRADVLIVPHHGSKTSSSSGFIEAVQPRFAIISAGRFNRFGHPHHKVVNRYRAREIEMLSTIEAGQLTLTIDKLGDDFRVDRYLSSYRHYWQL